MQKIYPTSGRDPWELAVLALFFLAGGIMWLNQKATMAIPHVHYGPRGLNTGEALVEVLSPEEGKIYGYACLAVGSVILAYYLKLRSSLSVRKR